MTRMLKTGVDRINVEQKVCKFVFTMSSDSRQYNKSTPMACYMNLLMNYVHVLTWQRWYTLEQF